MAWLDKRWSEKKQRYMWRLKWRDDAGKIKTRTLNTSDREFAKLALKQAQRGEGKAVGRARSAEEAFEDYKRERAIHVPPAAIAVTEHAIQPILDAWVEIPSTLWTRAMLVEYVAKNRARKKRPWVVALDEFLSG